MIMDAHRYCVIMAGGSSPAAYLRMTYDRFARFMPRENILVVTLAKYAATARILLPEIPEGNLLRLRTLSLQDNCLKLNRAEAVAELPFFPGEFLETCWPGHPDVPAVVTSGWTAPGQLRLRCHAVGNAPCGFEMLICFQENTATVQCFRSHDPLTDDYNGVVSGVLSGK